MTVLNGFSTPTQVDPCSIGRLASRSAERLVGPLAPFVQSVKAAKRKLREQDVVEISVQETEKLSSFTTDNKPQVVV